MITLRLEDTDSGTTVVKTFDSGETWMEIAKGFIYSLRGLTYEIPGDPDEYASAWEDIKDGRLFLGLEEEWEDAGGGLDEESEESEDKQMELNFNDKN